MSLTAAAVTRSETSHLPIDFVLNLVVTIVADGVVRSSVHLNLVTNC